MTNVDKLNDEELVDYEEDEEETIPTIKKDVETKESKKGSYAAIHTSGFRDFLLKPELLQAIADCGFEHPSEVQHECIPQAMLNTDIICQAKSGMGKTAVFVIAVLQQLEPQPGVLDTLVLCHTRELAYQIHQEFLRFSKYLSTVKVQVIYGGVPVQQQKKDLQDEIPCILVATPGRLLAMLRDNAVNIGHIKRFVLDECDKMLEVLDMRRDIQNIFKETPIEKQVMMFSATINKEVRNVCRKFARDPMEIFVDDESKLTLHGLQQYYIKVSEKDKIKTLIDTLDLLEFNQVVIFVKSVRRAIELNKVLLQSSFPSLTIHSGLSQRERIEKYNKFKDFKSRILVSTDLFGRGVDIERVNIVINYDMPETVEGRGDATDTYLHRVGRAGRFGTKGLALTFVSSGEDSKVLENVQSRFEVEITAMPDIIDTTTYMTA